MIPLSIIPVSGRCNLFRFNMNQYDLIMYLQPSKRYKTFTCAADLRTFPDMCLKWGNRGGFDINSLTFANRLRTRQKIGPHLLIHMNTLMRISALSTTKWQALLHFLSQHLICHSTVHTWKPFLRSDLQWLHMTPQFLSSPYRNWRMEPSLSRTVWS